MRIVLVQPSGSNWVHGQKDFSATASRMAPIGILSIAAYLEREGHEVFVHDCLGPGAFPDPDSNTMAILKYKPDMVGISATTSGFHNGYNIASIIKNEKPEIKTVFGGVHISSIGSEILQDFKDIDYLCIGEGEVTIAELADGKNPQLINGLVWRDGSNIITNPQRAFIKSLDDLPFPAYEKLKGFPGKYNLPLFSYIIPPGASMITSRGCPFQCSFCDRSVFNKGFRYNSAEYVYKHMKYLRSKFRVRHINIYDDIFTANRKRLVELCNMLIEKPLGLRFNCAVRVGQVDDELLKLLKKAGFLQLSIGVESGDPELLRIHKAGIDLESVRDTVKRIQQNGLRVKGLFIMGLPGETEESIRKTSDFVISLRLNDMNMSKFTPFPGAPVWSTIHAYGSFDNDWRKMNCLNFVFIPKDISSRERLDYLYNTHVKRFYSDREWRKKICRNIFQHRFSLLYIIRHFWQFFSAKKTFENSKDQ